MASLELHNWSELPHDLLVEIAECLMLFEDFISFGKVCQSWHLAAPKKNFRYMSSQVPLLMLPPIKGSNSRGFFNLSNGKIHQVSLPKVLGKRCYSSKGWLMTIGRDMAANLLHPFSGVEIKLPHLKTFKDWREQSGMVMKHVHFIYKFVLSSDPLTTSNYSIMVIYGITKSLGYYKSGDKTWTACNYAENYGFLDVIYGTRHCYAINADGDLPVFRVSNLSRPKKVIVMPEDLIENILQGLYLVKSHGTLFLVFRDGVDLSDSLAYRTLSFDVFEVDYITRTFIKVDNIGNHSFFLGNNSSFSIKASVASNCKSNCIYFTDDCWESYWDMPEGGGKDMGIYNLEDQIFESHFEGESYNRINPPMWIERNF